MLIAGDVGGTKTRLALYHENGQPNPIVETVYVSDDYAHLEDIVQLFIQTNQAQVTRAVFGMPGPVLEGVVKVTNLPWTVSEAEMQAALGIGQVKLLNDLEATAYGIPFLPATDLHALNPAPAKTGHKVVVAPGTGLGEAILFHHEGRYIASASEGGHTDFAPRNLFEIKLLEYLIGKFGHVSYERMCSGIGIPHIYDYLQQQAHLPERPDLEAKILAAEERERVPLIFQAALAGHSERCAETLKTFVSILGSEAGNMALKVLAKGGVYLGGGIPPKIIPALEDGTFMAAFIDKGRFSEMLSQIPVYVILNEKTAMFGAACYALGL
jgi:glucokinase